MKGGKMFFLEPRDLLWFDQPEWFTVLCNWKPRRVAFKKMGLLTLLLFFQQLVFDGDNYYNLSFIAFSVFTQAMLF